MANGAEFKIDQQYTAEEKQEFNKKMATDATKKELFAQKDRIKTEWKSSLYKELDGNLKIDVMNLGKKIIENKNSRAYQLLTEFCTRTGRNMQATENNINTGKTEKMDTFLLTAILQAGAIASCDNEAVLRNAKIAMITSGVEFRTSNAVDGDPRGNTMAALMGMFEDMKKAGVVTDADFDGGIPSANFIAQMYIYIQEAPKAATTVKNKPNTSAKNIPTTTPKNTPTTTPKNNSNTTTTPNVPNYLIPNTPNTPTTNPIYNGGNTNQIINGNQPNVPNNSNKAPETKVQFLDIQNLSNIVARLWQITTDQEYRVDFRLDKNSLSATKTLIFTKDKNGERKFKSVPEGKTGTWTPTKDNIELIYDNGTKSSLKEMQKAVNAVNIKNISNNAPEKKITFLDIQSLSNVVGMLWQIKSDTEYHLDLHLDKNSPSATKTLIFTKDKTGKREFVLAPDGLRGTWMPTSDNVELAYQNGFKANLKDIQTSINKPIPTPTNNNIVNPGNININNIIYGNTPNTIKNTQSNIPQNKNTPTQSKRNSNYNIGIKHADL